MINEWQQIEFAHPWILWGLGVIPLIIVWYIRRNSKNRAAFLISTTKQIESLKGIEERLFHTPFALRCLAIGLLIIALARPQKQFEEDSIKGEGIDIMLCLDVSGTMAYEDFLPNRLESSKELAKEFVKSRFGDRIGIVVFSSHGFTMCPLTTDTSAVLSQINNITDSLLSDEGTVIGTGIATCINRLKDSKSKTKIIILLSDGVNSVDAISPDIATALARRYFIKVYTIGIGSEREVEVVRHTPFGDIKVKEMSEFNETLLKRIAIESAGEYYHAQDKKGLISGFEHINKLEKSTILRIKNLKYKDQFEVFLIIGFALIFIEMLLRYLVFRKFP